jgi:hypothetical protein
VNVVGESLRDYRGLGRMHTLILPLHRMGVSFDEQSVPKADRLTQPRCHNPFRRPVPGPVRYDLIEFQIKNRSGRKTRVSNPMGRESARGSS